jgi:FKBP-type peptidyl-prolyl cis-trans isomerase FkpA
MRYRRLLTALLPLAFTACLSGAETITYPNIPIESTTFAASLNVNLAASTKTATGLYYRDIGTVGTGTLATGSSRVSVWYNAYFVDGQQFDAIVSPSTPFTFTLGTGFVIKGWDEGIVGMKVGGVRQLIIPPALAYGSSGYLSVPPNAVLVFTITLASVQ